MPIWRCPRPMGSASWRKARRDQLWGQGPSVVSQQGLAWPAPRRLAGALRAGRRAVGSPLHPPCPPPPPLWPRRPRGTFPTRLCLPRGPSPRNRPCSLPTPSRRWPSRAPAVGPPTLWLVLTAAPPSSAKSRKRQQKAAQRRNKQQKAVKGCKKPQQAVKSCKRQQQAANSRKKPQKAAKSRKRPQQAVKGREKPQEAVSRRFLAHLALAKPQKGHSSTF